MTNKVAEKNKKKTNKGIDFVFLLSAIILLFVGLIVLSSASSYYSLKIYNNSTELLNKQIFFAVLGVILMLIVAKIDYTKYFKWGYFGFGFGMMLMLAVFVPGLGRSINGANRWLNFGAFTFQPSELMKLFLIIALASYIVKNFKKPFTMQQIFMPILMTAIVCITMYFQSHASGAAIMLFLGLVLTFASGVKIKMIYIVMIIAAIVISGWLFLSAEDYRIKRITSFRNLESNTTSSNWQPIQSLYAIGSGGLFGKGLGQSLQKYSWLPEAQNDFVFAILGEEFGFVGTVVVISLYAFFIIKGFQIAFECNNKFGMLITAGIISMFAVQAIINIAVVTSSMPTTGMPLPFFSAGGTSLVINLAAVGIVLNVSRDRKNKLEV